MKETSTRSKFFLLMHSYHIARGMVKDHIQDDTQATNSQNVKLQFVPERINYDLIDRNKAVHIFTLTE